MDINKKLVNGNKKQIEHVQRDSLRLLFLILLYSAQGFAFGFLDVTMPVFLKRHFTYSEIGIISWSCLPFSVKFLFAPFVDTYFFKWLGKKRSWIVPTQLLIAAFNFCLAAFLPSLIDQQRYLAITFAFLLIVLLCALQDIAIDGWCLTMVSEDNRDNASLAQTIGVQIGIFLGTSFFYALSSIDFCNTYIYWKIQSEPLFNYSNFFTFWVLSAIDAITYNGWHIVLIDYSNTVANPIIASTQTTFIHSIGNFGYEFPKLYTYTLVDAFGVFAPNLVGCVLTLGICACLYSKANDPDLYKVMEIDDCNKKDDCDKKDD